MRPGPIAFALRRQALYRYCVLIPGSVAITLLGLGRLIERAFFADIGVMDPFGLKQEPPYRFVISEKKRWA